MNDFFRVTLAASLVMLLFVVIPLLITLSTVNRIGDQREALCPAGTVYVRSAGACLVGARPWEGEGR